MAVKTKIEGVGVLCMRHTVASTSCWRVTFSAALYIVKHPGSWTVQYNTVPVLCRQRTALASRTYSCTSLIVNSYAVGQIQMTATYGYGNRELWIRNGQPLSEKTTAICPRITTSRSLG